MPKLQIKATELVEPDVDIVAMVKRGANRIPFRIMKEDKEMGIDLHSIGRRLFQKQEPAPAVVAVLLSKSANAEVITAALVKAGIEADKFTKTETAEAVMFTKADAEALVKDENTQVLKLNEDVALVVTGLKKSFDGWDFESTSFKEIMSKGAFVPSICVAQDMLSRTIYNILEKADTPKEAATGIGAAVKEFSDYVTMLAKGLPESAFKADVALAKAMNGTGDGFEAGKGTGTTPSATADDAANSVNDGKKKKNPPLPAEAVKAEDADVGKKGKGNQLPDNTSGAGAQNSDARMEETVKGADDNKPNDPMADVLAALTKTINDGIAGVKQHVDQSILAVKADVDKVSERVGQVAEMAKKTDEALSGTVVGAETNENTRLRKAERSDGGSIPLLDTAFMKVDEHFPLDRKAAH